MSGLRPFKSLVGLLCWPPKNVWSSRSSRSRGFGTSSILCKSVAGKYPPTQRQNFPLTYEMAQRPFLVGVTKYWNSINEASFINRWNWKHFDMENVNWSVRGSETIMEDLFIRKFVTGTWHNLFVSEVIIKRQGNVIRVGGIIERSIPPRKMYFLLGYTEELLSYWIQCPVKLELQTVDSRKDVVFKYV